MDDEPEMRIRFQYKMSPKTGAAHRATGRRMLRVDEHHHAEFGTVEFGRNEGVRGREPQGRSGDRDARGDLWLGRDHAAESTVSETEQRTKRDCAPVSGESDRTQPSPDDTPGGVLGQAAVHSAQD